MIENNSEILAENDNNIIVIKYKYLKLENLVNINNKLYYDNLLFNLQTPVFNNYNIISMFGTKYLKLNVNLAKIKHVKFLNIVETIEKKINKNIPIKTQIIKDNTNISLKIKLNSNLKLYNKNKIEITDLLSKCKIILLLKFEINENYYSIICNQILEL